MDAINAYNRRWYDQVDNLTLALLLSQFLPLEMQMGLAKNLNVAIDQQRNMVRRNQKQVISVEPLNVAGIYKASKRQRWYDDNQGLFRAFNFMGTLPESYLSKFAGNVIILARQVHNTKQGLLYTQIHKTNTSGVLTMLQYQGIGFEETEQGFRLVDNALGRETQYIRPSLELPVKPLKF